MNHGADHSVLEGVLGQSAGCPFNLSSKSKKGKTQMAVFIVPLVVGVAVTLFTMKKDSRLPTVEEES